MNYQELMNMLQNYVTTRTKADEIIASLRENPSLFTDEVKTQLKFGFIADNYVATEGANFSAPASVAAREFVKAFPELTPTQSATKLISNENGFVSATIITTNIPAIIKAMQENSITQEEQVVIQEIVQSQTTTENTDLHKLQELFTHKGQEFIVVQELTREEKELKSFQDSKNWEKVYKLLELGHRFINDEDSIKLMEEAKGAKTTYSFAQATLLNKIHDLIEFKMIVRNNDLTPETLSKALYGRQWVLAQKLLKAGVKFHTQDEVNKAARELDTLTNQGVEADVYSNEDNVSLREMLSSFKVMRDCLTEASFEVTSSYNFQDVKELLGSGDISDKVTMEKLLSNIKSAKKSISYVDWFLDRYGIKVDEAKIALLSSLESNIEHQLESFDTQLSFVEETLNVFTIVNTEETLLGDSLNVQPNSH